MITSLRLFDFKNFDDETLRVGPFTVIVGANASGKSNIRDAFRFLHGIGCGYTLARDVALRLAGRNTKAIRQLELTYGGGKTHTLVALRHLVHDPEALPDLSAVDQFRSHIGAPLPAARIVALCFDKLDVEKGMEVRGPAGEPSRRVKDLAGAFAENPKLPKMLRRKEVLDTIDQGVLDGIFVASLVRPDKSIKTWWRTRIDEAARAEPALELCLPDKATLSELGPNVLAPGVLPELWAGESVAVADVVAYFAGGRTVTVQHEGYSEPVAIPACPRAAVEAATSDAVRKGVLWLVNGPASFQGEPVAPGVLTDAAELRAPMLPLSVDRLTKDAVPEAWKDGETSALALSAAALGAGRGAGPVARPAPGNRRCAWRALARTGAGQRPVAVRCRWRVGRDADAA